MLTKTSSSIPFLGTLFLFFQIYSAICSRVDGLCLEKYCSNLIMTRKVTHNGKMPVHRQSTYKTLATGKFVYHRSLQRIGTRMWMCLLHIQLNAHQGVDSHITSDRSYSWNVDGRLWMEFLTSRYHSCQVQGRTSTRSLCLLCCCSKNWVFTRKRRLETLVPWSGVLISDLGWRERVRLRVL